MKMEEKDRVLWMDSRNVCFFNPIFIFYLVAKVLNSFPSGHHLEFICPI